MAVSRGKQAGDGVGEVREVSSCRCLEFICSRAELAGICRFFSTWKPGRRVGGATGVERTCQETVAVVQDLRMQVR